MPSLPAEAHSDLRYSALMLGWLALVFGLIVLAALMLLLLASFTRRRAQAVAVIEKRLTSLDIDPAGFSRQCIAALAVEAIASAKRFRALGLDGPDQRDGNLEKHAEAMADQVYATLVGQGEFSAERIKEAVGDDAAPTAWSLLAKHDPSRFGLAALDKTQWTHAMMRGRASSMTAPSSTEQ